MDAGPRQARASLAMDRDGAPTPAVVDPRWRGLLSVVEAGSLSKAALVLSMPQSMVSRAVAQLERDSGQRFFVRTGRGVLPTEFATQLLPRLTQLLAALQDIAVAEMLLARAPARPGRGIARQHRAEFEVNPRRIFWRPECLPTKNPTPAPGPANTWSAARPSPSPATAPT